MYFERNGSHEYSKQFYEEAFHFIEEKFGANNVISAVMHADEINVAATEELGKEVYHYHLHAMVILVVEKEILKGLSERADKVRNRVVEPDEENMLNITNDGKKTCLRLAFNQSFAS